MLDHSLFIHSFIFVLHGSTEVWIFVHKFYIFVLANASKPVHYAVTYACICWMAHYAKRLFETQFIHRFSNGTMPRFNLFKVVLFILLTISIIFRIVHTIGDLQPSSHISSIILCLLHPALVIFKFTLDWLDLLLLNLVCISWQCEMLFLILGNLSIHILLRNLRPPGTRERRIPKPDGNPMSKLFNYVSCPNYTYEVASWIFFSTMVQSLPGLLFYTTIIWWSIFSFDFHDSRLRSNDHLGSTEASRLQEGIQWLSKGKKGHHSLYSLILAAVFYFTLLSDFIDSFYNYAIRYKINIYFSYHFSSLTNTVDDYVEYLLCLGKTELETTKNIRWSCNPLFFAVASVIECRHCASKIQNVFFR